MGENASNSASRRDDEFHILVTGFGPWGENTVNPAFLISRAVHEHLNAGTGGPAIKVHTLPQPVDVSYEHVRRQIPPLLFPPVTNNPPPTFDVVLFIGMAAGRNYYAVETRAFRDGYVGPDVNHKIPEGAEKDLWKQRFNAPEVLAPRWDADDVWRRWKTHVVDIDVRTSDDAGRYLCEFIYYTGLVEYWRRGKGQSNRVAFLHVPKNFDSQSVDKGVKVAEALIKALVESEVVKGNLRVSRLTH